MVGTFTMFKKYIFTPQGIFLFFHLEIVILIDIQHMELIFQFDMRGK